MSDMIGHGVYATGCDAQMQIQVAESFLPVQKMKQPNHDMPKEFVYDNNSRNPTFLIDIETSDGLCESHEKFWMEKTGIANCFQLIERIQDELNSYQ